MIGALTNPGTFPPYKGEPARGHQGWWHGGNHWWNHAAGPHRCPNDGVNPRWTVGRLLCGGVHVRYYIEGNGYVGGYGAGNDPCRANPWDRDSAWVCK